MAGLLKAIENGYNPSIREIVYEMESLPIQSQGSHRHAINGASDKVEFLEKIFKLFWEKL